MNSNSASNFVDYDELIRQATIEYLTLNENDSGGIQTCNDLINDITPESNRSTNDNVPVRKNTSSTNTNTTTKTHNGRRGRRHRARGKGKGKGEGEGKNKNTSEKNNKDNDNANDDENNNEYKFDATRIIDDIWIDIICFLTVTEFVYMKRSCKHFNKLICHGMQSISNNIRMNKFWKIQSLRLCSSIPYNYNTNDWYTFYFQIYKILQFGDYHNAQHYKKLVEKYKENQMKLKLRATKSRPDTIGSTSSDHDPSGYGGPPMAASIPRLRPRPARQYMRMPISTAEAAPLWLDRNVNPAWINDPFFENNPYLQKDLLTGYGYFVSNNIESSCGRIGDGKKRNNVNDNYVQVFTPKQQEIRNFMEKYGMRVKDLNREKFNLDKFNQSLPIKLVTDDYGFDLQLIDLICFFDAQLVLDMLLFKNENGSVNVYDMYYKFEPQHIGSDRYSRIGSYRATNVSSKDIEEKYSIDVLTIFYDYAAKHASIKVFKYLIKRFGISSIPVFYINDYVLHHFAGCYYWSYDPLATNYNGYGLTNILSAAMQGGDDEIINHVLNHPKLQSIDKKNDDSDSNTLMEKKVEDDNSREVGTAVEQKTQEEEEGGIIKIFNKKSAYKFKTAVLRSKRSKDIVYFDGIMDKCAVYGDYGTCQLFIGYSNWKNVQLTTIELIIDKFSKYINKSKQLRSPLHFIIECNQSSEYHCQILKTMLESAKINVNVKNYQSYTPFLFACTKNTHKKVMEILLESKRVDKFAQDKYKRNAIHLAVMYGRYELIEQIYYFLKKMSDKQADHKKNGKKQKDVLFDFFNSKEKINSATPYILACRSLAGSWIKHTRRKRLFEILIDVCKVDISIVDDQKLHGSDFVTYDDRLAKWLICKEKQLAKEEAPW